MPKISTIKKTRKKDMGKHKKSQAFGDLKKKYDELLVREKKYKNLIDSLPQVVFESDLKGRLTFVNKNSFNTFGYTNEDFKKGFTIFQMIISEDRTIAKKYIKKILNLKKDIPHEYTALKKDGTRFPVLINSIPIIKKGVAVGFRGILTNITERKKMEVKLAERLKEFNVLYRIHSHISSERSLSQVFSNVTCDIVQAFEFVDFAQAQICFNGKVYKSSGKKVKFIYKIERSIIVDSVNRGFVRVGYFKQVPKTNFAPFWQEEYKLIETVAHILSKHICAREVIERHKKIVQKSFTGLFIMSEGVVKYANARFCKIFKYNKDEVIFSDVSLFLNDCGRFKNRFVNSSSYRCKTTGKQKNGNLIDLDVIIQKIDYHGNEALLGRVQDITILKKAEIRLKDFNARLKKTVEEKTNHLKEANKRLRSLNDLKDEFIAVASHELRSPLTSIRGYLSFLAEKESFAKIPTSVRPYLLRAYHNTESLNHLVNNILDVSRFNTGRFELQITKVNIISLIKSIIDSLSFQAGDKKLKINCRYSKECDVILKVDAIRIAQVFRNLFDNSIKFSKRGGIINTEIKISKQFVSVKITDYGVGIPKAKLEEIFDKFMQVKNVDTRYKGGAGLGLFIARRIVELHNGVIKADSKKGKGTAFIVKLPL